MYDHEDELIVRLLARLDSAPPSGVLLGTLGSPIIVGVTSPVQGPSVGFETPDSSSVPSMAPLRFAAPPLFASAAISVAEQESFERFVRLAPPKFHSMAKEKSYDFLTKCQDRLFNLGILEAHGVSNPSYQFAGMAKEWWISVLSCRTVGSLVMGW
ncbi:hypothetical protein KY284_001002 [Solanum tuberosum]|nr:hypothetical protein KY284_001002 [Solanum tuberosum]